MRLARLLIINLVSLARPRQMAGFHLKCDGKPLRVLGMIIATLIVYYHP